MKSLFVWILWASIAASASAPPRQRHIQSGKGESFDTPEPHPLGYFTDDPFLRDDGDDFCSDCTPQGKATVHLEHKFKTEANKIGMLRGFAIYDVFYRFDDHVDAKTADWKSILVEASPGQFHEIYDLQPTAGELNPSYLFKVGSRRSSRPAH